MHCLEHILNQIDRFFFVGCLFVEQPTHSTTHKERDTSLTSLNQLTHKDKRVSFGFHTFAMRSVVTSLFNVAAAREDALSPNRPCPSNTPKTRPFPNDEDAGADDDGDVELAASSADNDEDEVEGAGEGQKEDEGEEEEEEVEEVELENNDDAVAAEGQDGTSACETNVKRWAPALQQSAS